MAPSAVMGFAEQWNQWMDKLGAERGTWDDLENLVADERADMKVEIEKDDLVWLVETCIDALQGQIHHGGEYLAKKHCLHDDLKKAMDMQKTLHEEADDLVQKNREHA